MGWLNIKGICFRQQRVDNIEKCSAVVFRGKEGGWRGSVSVCPFSNILEQNHQV